MALEPECPRVKVETLPSFPPLLGSTVTHLARSPQVSVLQALGTAPRRCRSSRLQPSPACTAEGSSLCVG